MGALTRLLHLHLLRLLCLSLRLSLHHMLRCQMTNGHGIGTRASHTQSHAHACGHSSGAGLHVHHRCCLSQVRVARPRNPGHLHWLTHWLTAWRHAWVSKGQSWLHTARMWRERGHHLLLTFSICAASQGRQFAINARAQDWTKAQGDGKIFNGTDVYFNLNMDAPRAGSSCSATVLDCRSVVLVCLTLHEP